MAYKNNVMIDIETLSTRPDALILTIAAVKFQRGGKKTRDGEKFYVRVCPESCRQKGLHIDAATQMWWENQCEEARYEALLNTDRIPLVQALDRLSAFIGSTDIVWANSPSFDCVILENAYSVCGKLAPWKFWNLRDLRTLKDLAGIKYHSVQNNHNALEDCYNQIDLAQKCFSKLL